MTTYHAWNTAERNAKLAAWTGGGTLYLHAGVYGPLDSYVTPIRGGTSWGTKLTIRAYGKDKVTIKGTAADPFCLRLAHPQNRFIEFVGIDFDGTDVQASCVKITNSDRADESSSAARFIRFTDCAIWGSPLSCVLVTSPSSGVEIIRSRVWGAGRPGTSGTSHAVYAPGGGVLVSKSWLHDCTGQGACFYSAAPEQSGAPLPAASRIEYSRVSGCGRAGILLAGQGDTAEGNTVVDCAVGLHVWPTAKGWSERDNLLRHNGEDFHQ